MQVHEPHGRNKSLGTITRPNGCTAHGTSPVVVQPFGKAPRPKAVTAGELDGLAVMKVDFVEADGADHFLEAAAGWGRVVERGFGLEILYSLLLKPILVFF